jgi:transposase-like protein
MERRKRYSRKFQRMAVERMRSSDNIGELAKELGVTRRCLYKWRTKLDHLELSEEGPRPNSHESAYRKQVHQLKRMLADKAMEVDFLKGALQKVEARRQDNSVSGGKASTNTSES